MRVVCPECFASYQVEAVIKNAVLVCHKCNTEFDSYGNRVVAGDATSQFFQTQEEHAPTFGIKDLVQSGMDKRKQHVWLWMSLILLLIAAAGIAYNWALWSHHGVFRGYQLQVQSHAPILDSDWQINPESVHSQWIKRDDGSLALVVEGEASNLIGYPLPPPELQITFITQTGQNDTIIQPITEPADMDTLMASPYLSPAVDKTSVFPLASRGFILVLEDVPLSTQHIVLHALAVQRKGKTKL
jgi:hypothetical protein